MTRRFNNRDKNPYKSEDHEAATLPKWFVVAFILVSAMGIGALAVHFFYQLTIDCI